MARNWAQIRKKARDLLKEFNVQEPPVPVRRLARGRGARIVKVPGADGDIDGFLYRENDETIVIGVNRDHAPVRQRFTIAHELGHLLLHEDQVHVDRGFRVRLRSGVSSEGIDQDEMEANRFAAELLMPIDILRADLRKTAFDLAEDDDLRALARRYGVSMQAFAIRLNGLGYSIGGIGE